MKRDIATSYKEYEVEFLGNSTETDEFGCEALNGNCLSCQKLCPLGVHMIEVIK